MASALRRIVRNERKRLVADFKKDQKVSNKQLGAFCFMEKQPFTLNGKVNTIIELHIRALEEKWKEQNPEPIELTDEVVDNG